MTQSLTFAFGRATICREISPPEPKAKIVTVMTYGAAYGERYDDLLMSHPNLKRITCQYPLAAYLTE